MVLTVKQLRLSDSFNVVDLDNAVFQANNYGCLDKLLQSVATCTYGYTENCITTSCSRIGYLGAKLSEKVKTMAKLTEREKVLQDMYNKISCLNDPDKIAQDPFQKVPTRTECESPTTEIYRF
ncbi:hypothetical protein GJ496_002481 [Pomphorhynchus laevis]|nr:hypothetical protein GJ496_002481 [Pomphorhynchus laevis]